MKLSLNPCRWLLLSFALTQIASAATPVLTSFDNISGTQDTNVTLSFTVVDDAANVSNLPDGDPTGYDLEGSEVVNGSLDRDGDNKRLSSGESWTWTPPAGCLLYTSPSPRDA